MKRHLLLLAALTALPAAADDFGIWTGATVQKSLGTHFSIDASLGFRSQDRLRQATRWDASLGADYSPLRWLSFGTGYTYIYGRKGQETNVRLDDDGSLTGYNVDHGYWRSRHRFTLDASAKHRFGRFTLSLRERYQLTRYADATTARDRYRRPLSEAERPSYTGATYEWNGTQFARLTSATDDKPAKTRHLLRSRFGIDYNIRHCAFTPYATFEFHNDLADGLHLDKSRLTVGTEWKLSKQHRLDFAYVLQTSHDADDNDDGRLHALSIGYKFRF